MPESDVVFYIPGFKQGGCEMLYPDHEILQGIIFRIDAPDNIVHPFHELNGVDIDFVHRCQGLKGIFFLYCQIAENGYGAEGRTDVIVQVLGNLIPDMLKPRL